MHLSLRRSIPSPIEYLVAYGANVNAVDRLGNTPLHIVTSQKDLKPISQDTPEMLKVCMCMFN